MEQMKVVYYDDKNDNFAFLIDDERDIHFCYWYEFKKLKVSYLSLGDILAVERSSRKLRSNERGVSLSALSVIDNGVDELDVVQDCDLTEADLLNNLACSTGSPLIFIDCKFSNIDLSKQNISVDIFFLGCQFDGIFRWVESRFEKNLGLSNCQFKKQFSLKSSCVLGSIHLENADFSGQGGASFRGVTANNIYMDLGVCGGRDLIWMNEMVVSGVLSIGGEFNNEFQILGYQDESGREDDSVIGAIFIGKELYEFDKINITSIKDVLKIDGVIVPDGINILSISVQSFVAKNIKSSNFIVDSMSTVDDLIIEGIVADNLIVSDSSVGRHLKVESNKLDQKLNFTGTSVSEVSYLENNDLGEKSSLNLTRFTTSRLLIFPVDSLFGSSKFSVFKPKSFGLLEYKDKRNLGDQYCSLKHWLADAGRLDMEDIAYFYMRESYHGNIFSRMLFGGVFGWGVRLSNVALSSLLLMVAFSVIYFHFTGSLFESISLSVQSFISSFFGEWTGFKPYDLISSIVTLESSLGVLFITVFVGAYIRKLLR